jgi:hypothetical protein
MIKNKMMDKLILTELLDNQMGNTCVSILITTEIKSFTDKEKIKLKLKNRTNYIENKLYQKYNKEKADGLILSIKSLMDQIDLNHLKKGLGIYVSPNYSKLVFFPLPIEEKIIIDTSFEISDIIESLDKMIDYFIIALSKNSTKLYKGYGNSLFEINDENFPQHFENEFQISRTSPYSMYNDEESKFNEKQLDDYFRKIDKLLNLYTKNEPIVVLGVIEHISRFKLISKHQNNIIANFKGNFDKHTNHEIIEMIWPEIENYHTQESELYSS